MYILHGILLKQLIVTQLEKFYSAARNVRSPHLQHGRRLPRCCKRQNCQKQCSSGIHSITSATVYPETSGVYSGWVPSGTNCYVQSSSEVTTQFVPRPLPLSRESKSRDIYHKRNVRMEKAVPENLFRPRKKDTFTLTKNLQKKNMKPEKVMKIWGTEKSISCRIVSGSFRSSSSPASNNTDGMHESVKVTWRNQAM